MCPPAPDPAPAHAGAPDRTPVDEVAQAGDGGPPRVRHPGWREAFPWLVQGTTLRAASVNGSPEWDLGLFGQAPSGQVLDRWRELGRVSGLPHLVHGRQVHGRTVRVHDHLGGGGLQIGPEVDGWVTRTPGALLTVATADCVPVFLVAPRRRAVGLLHAGWRGVVEGILEGGVETLAHRMGSPARELRLHLGPAICGSCYEVGPEVHGALGLEVPEGPRPVDLRAVLAERAVAAGVRPGHVTVSRRCTRCDPLLFSHRGGDRGRQISFIGRAA